MFGVKEISTIKEDWESQWPKALKIWSDYVKLREPRWYLSFEEVKREDNPADSFAWIRLNDHRIFINLELIVKHKLEDFSLEILAHEIGHHIYTPANLKDAAVTLGKIRWALVGMEDQAPMVANLYEDFLINDRLQRGKGLDMVGVYKSANKDIPFDKIWTLYMRTYEYLWKLKRGTLATDKKFHSDTIDADSSIIASLIRSYSKNWLEGATRFAAMLFPYFIEDQQERENTTKRIRIFLDTIHAGKGGGIVSGMGEIDKEQINGIIDPRAETLGKKDVKINQSEYWGGRNPGGGVGPEQRYLNPGSYIDLMQQVNPNLEQQQLINNYYKEAAIPYLINFPVETKSTREFDLPEGMDIWNVGDSVDEIDWVQTSIYTSQIFPGINTLKRTYGPSGDEDESLSPFNVYIGIDCSGSMSNPKQNFSWPVLAATIIGLSALRAGAKVMGCLSGEPGKYLQNKDFESNENEILTVITSYLGTGYAYGIQRLVDAFPKKQKEKSHIVIVTDDDIFAMLGAKHLGWNEKKENQSKESKTMWNIMETALENAGGSGTLVLHAKPDWHQEEVARLKTMGWNIHYVTNQNQLVEFAESFTKINY